MAGSPERSRRQIGRTLASLALPTVLAANAACTQVNYGKFPDCTSDPQTKTADVEIGENISGGSIVAHVDGISFKRSQMNHAEIDIFSNEKNRVTIVKPNEVVSFKGLEDGRIYVVTFNQDSDERKRRLNVVGTCDTTPQTNP